MKAATLPMAMITRDVCCDLLAGLHAMQPSDPSHAEGYAAAKADFDAMIRREIEIRRKECETE